MIYNSVVVNNEYRLPRRLPRNSIVVDIGAHAGMFSFAALSRGAGVVYAFEPEPNNFRCAGQNLAQFGSRVRLSNAAVWRSDIANPSLHFFPSADAANTGGGTVIWDTDGPAVQSVKFDDVIRDVTEDGKNRIALLKIDCEGAEFPILLTSRRLDQIDRIVGEYHELRAELPKHAQIPGVEEFSVQVLVRTLESAGFSLATEPQASGTFGEMGLFFADRPNLRLVDRLRSIARRFV